LVGLKGGKGLSLRNFGFTKGLAKLAGFREPRQQTKLRLEPGLGRKGGGQGRDYFSKDLPEPFVCNYCRGS